MPNRTFRINRLSAFVIFIMVLGLSYSSVESSGEPVSIVPPISAPEQPDGAILFSDNFSDGAADGWTPMFDGIWSVDNYQYSTVTHGRFGLQGYTGSLGDDNTVRFDNIFVKQLNSVYLPVVLKSTLSWSLHEILRFMDLLTNDKYRESRTWVSRNLGIMHELCKFTSDELGHHRKRR